MKNKILKNGKSALSLVVALAVIAVSLFIAVPFANMTTNAAVIATDTWNGNKTKPTATDSDGNIIINTAEELAWVALDGGAETNGKSYKVAVGQIFDMNGFTGVTLDSTVAEVKAATATGNLWRGTADNTYFGGNFDGNGLIVYNLNSWNDGRAGGLGGHGGAGLFPYAAPYQAGATQSFKNVTVKASAFKAYHGIGGIVGYSNPNTTDRHMIYSDCAIEEVFLYTHTYQQTAGGIIGIAGHNGLNVNNCLIKNVEFTATKYGGFAGTTSNYSPNHAFSNSVVIGASPISNGETGTKLTSATYTNIYTDAEVSGKAGVIPNDLDKLTGQQCNKLDFATHWLANSDLPELRASHKLAATDNGDGTHSEKCERCNIAGFAAEHNFNIVIDETTDGCACGLTQAAPIRPTDTWNGEFVKPTKKENGVYIIQNAEELAWVALKGGAETNGNSYKVADGQIFDLGGFEGINLNSTLDDVKNATATGKLWRGTENLYFGGNFDGNGLIVYNLNSNKDGSATGGHGGAGLFPFAQPYQAKETQTFSNVKVMLSAFKAYHGAGGIVGYANPGSTDRHWVFENIAVDSVYLYTHTHQQRAGGIVGNAGHSGITIDNCLVANVEIVGKTTGGLVASTSAYSPNHKFSNSVVTGISPVSNETGSKLASATYENVYTDVDASYAGVKVDKAMANKQLEGLDPTVWFANTTKAPVLKQFHFIAGTSNGAAGHTEKCKGCGVEAIVVVDHDWSANNGKCAVCDYACQHENATDGAVAVEGDCTTNREIIQICECGAAPNRIVAATGHELTKAADHKDADCGNDGHHAYWACSKCGGYTLSDDKMAPAVDYDTQIRIPATGAHTPATDASGEVYDTNLAGYHRNLCEKCLKPYNPVAHTGEFTAYALDPASGHTGTCTACGVKTNQDNPVIPHAFGDDSVCDSCGWECKNHADDNGTVTTEYNCITTEVTEYKCTICARVRIENTKVADGHNFEAFAEVPAKCNADGKKAHNHCSECGKNYAPGADYLTVTEDQALSDEFLALTERPGCVKVTVPEVPSTCKDTGTLEHQKCDVCGKLYDMNDNEVELKDLEIALKPHAYANIAEGKPVWEYDDTHHWHICSICDVVDMAEHDMVTDALSYEGELVHCSAGCGGGKEIFVHKNSSKDKVVSIESSDNAFDRNVWTTFTDIVDEDAIYANLEAALSSVEYNTLIAYDITPDTDINPDGTVTITFNVPEEFGKNVAIYYIDTETKKSKLINTEVVSSDDGKTRKASVTVDSFEAAVKPDYSNVYALLDLDKAPTYPPVYDNENNNNDYGDIGQSPATASQNAAAAVMAVAGLIAVAFIAIRKAEKA